MSKGKSKAAGQAEATELAKPESSTCEDCTVGAKTDPAVRIPGPNCCICLKQEGTNSVCEQCMIAALEKASKAVEPAPVTAETAIGFIITVFRGRRADWNKAVRAINTAIASARDDSQSRQFAVDMALKGKR